MNINIDDSGAMFSEDRKYRYALWRIWDRSLPLVMFIGLNPSTADETDPDPTIRSVGRIAKYNGYGGIVMMNCFAYVSTNPDDLIVHEDDKKNEAWLIFMESHCKDVVFAWGAFAIIRKTRIDEKIFRLFPTAKALHINKSGSPKHPLYCKTETDLVDYNTAYLDFIPPWTRMNPEIIFTDDMWNKTKPLKSSKP